ncbi:hypothetical protein LWI29_037003 [Acer saccharum]|uniref:Uncharacterized protein n=1 Tax=Acer saccharum TaxID=4024 RepID=A0AA39SSV6_ACESA|nr:hypothetical protein LWI29_037003 [Acer saccharum]
MAFKSMHVVHSSMDNPMFLEAVIFSLPMKVTCPVLSPHDGLLSVSSLLLEKPVATSGSNGPPHSVSLATLGSSGGREKGRETAAIHYRRRLTLLPVSSPLRHCAVVAEATPLSFPHLLLLLLYSTATAAAARRIEFWCKGCCAIWIQGLL